LLAGIAARCAVTFQIETIDVWSRDFAPLFVQQWRELGLDQDLKPDFDFEKMRLLEQAGCFVAITARNDGQPIGYVIALFSTHLHYKSSPKMFIVDAYYLLPEFRNGIGAKMLKYAEAAAKTLGAIKIYLTCKVHQDHSELFKALGYKLSDYAFIKRI
jgi:GNAT superfamily N-acetyltransferase